MFRRNLILALIILIVSNPLQPAVLIMGYLAEEGECVASADLVEQAPPPPQYEGAAGVAAGERGGSGAAADAATDFWLGGEPNFLSVEEEKAGVAQILKGLTNEQQAEIVESDTTMPIRYFRGAKGDVAKALNYIPETLQWRRDFRVNAIVHSMEEGGDEDIRKSILQEVATGSMYVRNYDVDGRAIICAHLGARNTGDEESQLRALVFLLEKAFACTARMSRAIGGRPLEKVIMVFSFDGYSRKTSYPFHTLKKVNEILSYQYPERLTAVYLIRPPMVFSVLWKMIRPFIDPVTRKKYIFCNSEKEVKKLTSRVLDLHKLEAEFGGTGKVRPFDSQEYLNLPLNVAFDEWDEQLEV